MKQAADVAANWKARTESWKLERAAGLAVLFAILSSLGTLVAWSSFLSGNDIRLNPAFWLMAVPAMVWYGAVQGYSRWAIRTLPLAIAAWPVGALGALLLCRAGVRHGVVYHLATPPILAGILGYTLLTAMVAGVCLRRSSLPGGRGVHVVLVTRSRAPDALPPPDAAFRSLMPWIFLSLFSWMFVAILCMAGRVIRTSDVDRMMRTGMLPLVGVIVCVVVCLAWGSTQARRTPTRLPPAMLAMAGMEVGYSILQVGFLIGEVGMTGLAMLALTGLLAQAGSSLMLLQRLRQRARSYGGIA